MTNPPNAKTVSHDNSEPADTRPEAGLGLGRGGGRVGVDGPAVHAAAVLRARGRSGPVPVRRVLGPVRGAEWGRQQAAAERAVGRLGRLACGSGVEEEQARVELGRALAAVRRAGWWVKRADSE